jgi:hypothetical protein
MIDLHDKIEFSELEMTTADTMEVTFSGLKRCISTQETRKGLIEKPPRNINAQDFRV